MTTLVAGLPVAGVSDCAGRGIMKWRGVVVGFQAVRGFDPTMLLPCILPLRGFFVEMGAYHYGG